VAAHPGGTSRDAILAWLFLVGCWTTRASGSTLLLAALGAGFSPGPSFPRSAGARRVDPAFATLLVVGHPHNGALQIWTELGAVGACLALAVLGLVLRLLATLPDEIFAPGLALLAAAVSVSLVGHGLWQGWWAAAIGAAIVFFRIGPQDRKVGVP